MIREPNMNPQTADAYCLRVLATLVAQRVIGGPEMTVEETHTTLDNPPFNELHVGQFLKRLHSDGLATEREHYREIDGRTNVYTATDLGVRRILGAS